MKILKIAISVALIFNASHIMGAQTGFRVKNRHTIIKDGRKTYKHQRQTYYFHVEVIGDNTGRKPETGNNRHPSIIAEQGERYAVRLHNPLPVRVAVNLTIDGINSVTGKPCGIADGTKWVIAPHSVVTIRGWQVNGNESRRFFFTDKPKSYAKWRGEKLDQDLSVNCGVIGAAYFWNKKELQRYFDTHPTYVYSPCPRPLVKDKKCSKSGAGLGYQEKSSRSLNDISSVEEMEAGTGMGERESHPTTWVNFQYDTGMYKLSQAVIIYYDFAKPHLPNPFPAAHYAPEMF